MINRIRYLIPLTIFLLLLVLFWYGLGKDPNLLPSNLINKSLPAFTLPGLADSQEKISDKQFIGKITLLNIWAAWCGACKIEHPLLIDLAKKERVHLVGLNYKDERANALDYLEKTGNPFEKIIYDPHGQLAMQLGVYGTPETFLIDRKGIVRYRYVGPITLEFLENDLLPRISKMEAEV